MTDVIAALILVGIVFIALDWRSSVKQKKSLKYHRRASLTGASNCADY
jgi:ABC-type dipeptide/oligopeptide/nickel transport system permease subunit